MLNDHRLYDTLNSDISLTDKANKDEDVLTKDIAETDQINVTEHEELNMDNREGTISDKNWTSYCTDSLPDGIIAEAV